MKRLHLRYVGSVIPITGILDELYRTNVTTMRGLLDELDGKYGGFCEMFVDNKTKKVKLNAMIYYCEPCELPVSVIDLDQPIEDGAKVTFW